MNNDGTAGTLNQYFQPTDAPVANRVHPNNAFFFNEIAGRNAITATKVKSIFANHIIAGTIIVPINLGSTGTGYVLIDGANNRILVNDGTTNRIVIGSV